MGNVSKELILLLSGVLSIAQHIAQWNAPLDKKLTDRMWTKGLVDLGVLQALTKENILFHHPKFATVLPMKAPGDHSCLPHSAALALWGRQVCTVCLLLEIHFVYLHGAIQFEIIYQKDDLPTIRYLFSP